MAIHRYNSFGRTRQAKNLAGKHEAEVVASTSNPSASTDGYATENQKSLHLYFTESQSSSKTITLYGYIHAFGEWFIVKDSSGTNVTITASNATVYKIGAEAIDITGLDRVYFKTTGALHANDVLYAAASTIVGS